MIMNVALPTAASSPRASRTDDSPTARVRPRRMISASMVNGPSRAPERKLTLRSVVVWPTGPSSAVVRSQR